MKVFRCKRFLGPILVAAAFLLASMAHASTVPGVNLTLRLDATGYENVRLLNQNFDVSASLGFVDSRDNIIGLRPVPDFGFSIGGTYSLAATPTSGISQPLGTCSFGPNDCRQSFFSSHKSNGQQQFSIGDGTGSTVFGDFDLSGGTNIGDRVTLSTFAGADYLQLLNAGGLNFVAAQWSADVHVFTVVENNLAPIPLPASVLMLLSAIAGLGAMRSLRRGPTVPAG
jgi:hypothetical protein